MKAVIACVAAAFAVLAVVLVDGRTPAPAELEAACGMGRLYCDGGDYDTAVRTYEALMKRTGGAAFVRLGLARTCFERGDLARAEREYHALLTEDADSPLVLYDLGQVLLAQGRWGEAREFLRRFGSLYGEALPDLARKAEELAAADHRPAPAP